MIVSATNIVILVLIAVCAWLSAKRLFQKDTEIENRRRSAVLLAGTLQKYGLKKTASLIGDYAVGDYSGMAHKIADLSRLFISGEEHVLKELEQVFSNVLSEKLKTEEGRALIAARLAEVTAATTTPASTVK
jgi:hypothetical protein